MPMSHDEAVSALKRVREKYPQYAGLDDATLSGKLAAKYSQYAPISEAIRTNPQYPQGAADLTAPINGLSAPTPGNVSAWAARHIESLKKRGIEVTPGRQAAIMDLYKQQAGRTDTTGRDFDQEQDTAEAQAREESVVGRFHNAGLSFMQNLGDTATDLIGTVAPQTAANMDAEAAEFFNVGDTRSASAGSLAAEGAKLVTAARLLGGPKALGGFYGLQGFGGSREDTARLREQGNEVSTAGELGTAAGVGTVEGLSGYVGGRLFGAIASRLRGADQAVRGVGGNVGAGVADVAKALGLSFAEGGEEALTTLLTNAISKGIDPQRAVMGGVKEAFLTGMILSPLGAGGMDAAQQAQTNAAGERFAGQVQQQAQATPPLLEAQQPARFVAGSEGVTDLQNPTESRSPDRTRPAETPLEQQLIGQQATEPTTQERDAFFGTGTSEPRTLLEDRLVRTPIPVRSEVPGVPDPQNVEMAQATEPDTLLDHKLIGLTPEQQATPPMKRRLRGEAFDEQVFFDRPATPDERTVLRQQLEEEKQARRTDELTGAPNLVAYKEDTDRIFKEADTSKESLAVAESDLGNFKVVNDALGHEVGDQLLKAEAESIREALRMPPQKGRPSDWAGNIGYRVGGDEFPAILRQISDPAVAEKVLQRASQIFDKKAAKLIGNKLPKEAYPFIAWGVEVRKPGDKRSLKDIRLAAEEKVIPNKNALKKARGIPESREALTRYLAEHKARTAKAPTAEGSGGVPDPATRAARKAEFREQRKAMFKQTGESVKKATPLAGTSHKRLIPRSVEDWITPVSSRIRDLSPRMFDRLMGMQFQAQAASERLRKELVDPAHRMREALGGRGSEKYKQFAIAVQNGDMDAAKALLPESQRADLDAFTQTFRTLFDNAREAGVDMGDLGENYWPRLVKDYRGLKEVAGGYLGEFEDAWNTAKGVRRKALLTAAEKVEIANSVLQGFGPRKPGSMGPRNARKRTLAVTPETVEHYADPLDAAFQYVDAMTYAAERSRFLGRNAAEEDLIDTAGALVKREVEAGNLKADDQDELHALLTSRFTADMLKTGPGVRAAKQLVYLSALAQLRASITQTLDVGITAADYGVKNTGKGLKAAVGLTKPEARLVMEDLGIHDHGEEFKDVGRLAKVTNEGLRWAGFSRLDRLGKETRINAAWAAMQAAAKGPKGSKFEREYRPILGTDRFDAVMKDLRDGKKTEDVKYLAFLETAKVQPVTLSQMPKKYLDMPNGRIIYTLKTFFVTQLDNLRRQGLRKLRTPGERKDGARYVARLLALGTLMGLGVDILKDLLNGKEINVDQLPERTVDAALGLIGLNRYAIGQASQDPVEAVMNWAIPKFNIISDPVADVYEGVTGKRAGNPTRPAVPGLRTVRNLPVVGDLLYYHAPFGEGFHKKQEAAKAEFRAKLKELRAEAAEAQARGDGPLASQLLAIYNDRRKEGPGDGRKLPLTIPDLQEDNERREKRERTDAN